MGKLYFCLRVKQLICLEWLCQSEIEGGRERGCPPSGQQPKSFACMVYLMQSCMARLHSYRGRTTVWELGYNPPVSSCYDTYLLFCCSYLPSRMNLSSIPLLSTPTHTHTVGQPPRHPPNGMTTMHRTNMPATMDREMGRPQSIQVRVAMVTLTGVHI